MKGLVFYNCGKNSGYTQSHKHIQSLPSEGFKFPLIKMISQACYDRRLVKDVERDIHFYPGFKFVHGIAVLGDNKSSQ